MLFTFIIFIDITHPNIVIVTGANVNWADGIADIYCTSALTCPSCWSPYHLFSQTGIGKETARVLLGKGATVYAACRSQEKGEQAIKDLKEATEKSSVQLVSHHLPNFFPLHALSHSHICVSLLLFCSYQIR